LKQQVERLTNRLALTKQELEALEENEGKKDDEIKDLKSQLSSAKLALETERTRHADDVRSRETEMQQLQRELDAVRAHNSSLVSVKTELKDLNEQKAELLEKLETQNQRIHDLLTR